MYSSVAGHEYPGLDLVSTPDEAGCIDCLNVDFERRGAVRSRDGYEKFNAQAGAAQYVHIQRAHDYSTLATRGGNSAALSTAGEEVATQATFVLFRAVAFGTPAASATYITGTSSGSITTVRKYSSTAFSTPTATVDGVAGRAMPKGTCIAVQSTDNRLVVGNTTSTGGPHGASSSSSHVWFSNPGDAESWSTSNYVQLTPGDGEEIAEIVSWGDLVFVFKQTRAFVFYGTSTDSAGNPIFNYRTINLRPGRLSSKSPDTLTGSGPYAVGAPEGVYFVTSRGVYRTTGGRPVEVSTDVAPIFAGAASSFFQGGSFHASTGMYEPSHSSLAWQRDKLFVSMYRVGDSASAGDRVLVFDTRVGRWSLWALAASSLLAGWGTEDALFFTYTSGGNYIGRLDATVTDDDGTAIVSRYRTGFSDLGTDEEKSIVQAELWGTGTVNYQLSKDFGSLDTATSVAMGTSPAIARGPAARRGGKAATLFSWQVGASSGAWTLHRLTHRVQSKSLPGQKTP